ncbi:STAS-like domain-containing protein [Kribbella sp. NPDC005582]|uniref:STAS-like domain-containing protein n=1 Tax=Kribbella sp. NPDC005582 TaxID=3156893 RepID=UPI00339FA06F
MTGLNVFSVARFGKFPTTRIQGREARALLEDLLANQHDIDLTIDFTGVTAMTHSFLDEFLGKFLTTIEPEESGLTVKVMGLNDENAESLTVSLERRNASVAVLHDGDASLSLVGDPIAGETFRTVIALGRCKATEVAEALSTSAQNANNRLKRLVTYGAARKIRTSGAARGGKEFLYEAVTSYVPDAEALVNLT